MAFTRAWDETAPPDNQEAKYGAQRIREFKTDINERVSQILNMTTQGAALVTARFTATFTLLAAARQLWFYENTAPSGWTIVAAAVDAVLGVKGGSAAYNGTGGTQVGTWTQPNHTHTGPSHTHTVDSHTHTYNTVISHTHTIPQQGSWVAPSNFTAQDAQVSQGSNNGGAYATTLTGSTGEGSGTTSGTSASTGAAGTGATSASATANTWRPLAQIGIICSKDAYAT